MTKSTRFQPDQVDPTAYIAPGAVVVGDVTIGPQSSVWFNAVIRGDVEAIRIGSRTNIQDLALLHADEGFPCTLGDRVTVGHSAIVHGARVDDDVMIGMRAVVMNGATIGAGSIVAVGAVVLEGTIIPPNSVAMGVPAQVKRPTDDRDRQRIAHAADHYVTAAARYASASH
jgi:carbonic anhydrase/acetyltransferase-like protein (isoleucine patch superfamily)